MTRESRAEVLGAAIGCGLVGKGGDEDEDVAVFMDLDLLAATLAALKRAPFPPGTLHAFAIKANPVGRLLQIMREAGLGAEVASLGELRQALACGFVPDRVVFDSPIKTPAELRFALRAGVRLNLDNLQELDRVAQLIKEDPSLLDPPPPPSPATAAAAADLAAPPTPRLIGLRINPQVGEGSISALSTAGRVSKFGIPLLECRAQLLAAFRAHPWLNALHLHVGSQGVPLELTVEGVAAVAALAAEVEAQAEAEAGQQAAAVATAATAGPSLSTPAQQQQQPQRRRRRVLALDIGGGLPVMYGTDDLSWLLGATAAAGAAAPAEAAAAEAAAVSVFDRYARLLQLRVPSLFPIATSGSSSSSSSSSSGGSSSSGSSLLPPLQLVTEFGRCLVAKAAFAAGRVEYTKQCGGRRVVVSGLGGDLLLRAVYLPHTWPVRVELCDAAGQPKQPPARGGAAASTPPRAPASEGGGAAAGAAVVADGGAGEDGGGGDGGDVAPADVVGPLCFQGDKLAEAAPLPAAAPGDWVLVPDVGAYTLSMHSRYNSRCSPPVWAFRRVEGGGGGGEVGVGVGVGGVGEGQAEMGGLGEIEGGAVEEGAGAGAGGNGRGSGGRGLALPAEWGGDVRRCGAYEFVMLRRGESVEDVLAFWNRV